MMKSALICHRGDHLNEDGMARWMTSFSDLRLIVLIDDPPAQFKKRIRAEIKRSGWLGLLDVLAFRIWFRLFRAAKEAEWEAEELKKMQARFPDIPKTCQVLSCHSPNQLDVETALKEVAPDFAIARCKRILKERIFTLPRHGIFVIHPGICPDYRNSHGCFWAIVREDYENVGATLLKIDAGIDTGPVFGYFRSKYDPLQDSYLRIQNRVVFENLEDISDLISRVLGGQASPIDTSNRPSGVWGQPRLTTFLKWRSRYFRTHSN